MPGADQSNCREQSPKETFESILGVKIPDREYVSSKIGGFGGRNITHFHLECKGGPCVCGKCGARMSLYDRRERARRHADPDKSLCYIHAEIPGYRCDGYGQISQVEIPWADPDLTYSNRFTEAAIELMSSMSLRPTARHPHRDRPISHESRNMGRTGR